MNWALYDEFLYFAEVGQIVAQVAFAHQSLVADEDPQAFQVGTGFGNVGQFRAFALLFVDLQSQKVELRSNHFEQTLHVDEPHRDQVEFS